jgi:DNA repair protein RadC
MSKVLQEQMKRRGVLSLTDKDLLSILFRQDKEQNANKVLSNASYNLNVLAKMSIEEITSCGVRESEATYVVAALELGRRRDYRVELQRDQITGSKAAWELMRPLIGDLNYEEFWIIYLNRQNKVISTYKVSQGGITGTLLDVRLVLKKALEQNATSMILCHNHPSGNLEPSDADKKITRQVKEAAEIMEIPVIDHVIVTQNGYYSFADEGML